MSDALHHAMTVLLTKGLNLERQLEAKNATLAAAFDPILEDGEDPELVAALGAAEVSSAPYTLESLSAKVEELEELVLLVAGSSVPGEDAAADADAAAVAPVEGSDDAVLLAAGIVLGDDVVEEEPVDFEDVIEGDVEKKGVESVIGPCPRCGATEVDEYEDGLAVCQECGLDRSADVAGGAATAAPAAPLEGDDEVEDEDEDEDEDKPKAWAAFDAKSWDAATPHGYGNAAEMAELLARRDRLDA